MGIASTYQYLGGPYTRFDQHCQEKKGPPTMTLPLHPTLQQTVTPISVLVPKDNTHIITWIYKLHIVTSLSVVNGYIEGLNK